jgi:hypothetical protein
LEAEVVVPNRDAIPWRVKSLSSWDKPPFNAAFNAKPHTSRFLTDVAPTSSPSHGPREVAIRAKAQAMFAGKKAAVLWECLFWFFMD